RASAFTGTCSRCRSRKAPASSEATRWERSGRHRLGLLSSTLSFASTVSRSIPYNGSESVSHMTSRTRAIVLSITAPVVVFAIVGGLLGRAMAREDTYQHLKIFDDVVSLISSNYVEPVNLDKVMRGAMNGLADSLDADSAYLTPDEVRQVETG